VLLEQATLNLSEIEKKSRLQNGAANLWRSLVQVSDFRMGGITSKLLAIQNT
jgi:hypothetical protein